MAGYCCGDFFNVGISAMSSLHHGGNLPLAAQQYGIPVSNWLDLSTGISPFAYPIPEIPKETYTRLPYEDKELLAAAHDYYLAPELLDTVAVTTVTGTQAAIELLPSLLPSAPVLLPDIGYREHQWHWQAKGQTSHIYAHNDAEQISCLLQQHDAHLVLINPNNPTGSCFSPEQILQWAQQLKSKRYLIVDEAFMDTRPQTSLLSQSTLPPNIIVLRSFGKFFGLAGLRLGFVFGPAALIEAIRDRHLTWGISGPAQFIGTLALRDKHWQNEARQWIKQASSTTAEILQQLPELYSPLAQQGLFHSFECKPQPAQQCFDHFARQGILLRLIEDSHARAIIRFGLIDPGNLQQIQRADDAMRTLPLL
jgi:cobalamin biosynthetic protein CobC